MKKFVAFILRLLNSPTQHHTKDLPLATSDIDWAGAPTKNLTTYDFRLMTVALLLLLLTSCSKDESLESSQNLVAIRFHILCNGEKLAPNVQYINKSGELFSVNAFKMYLGAITLQNNITQQFTTSQQYHLLNYADSTSLLVNETLAVGTYNQLAFTIGVDSLHSVSGSQTGALDPLNSMFWTWNTGYINAKFEGISPASTTIGKAITYHIGGFKNGENTQRTITIPFPPDLFLTLADGITNEINVDIHLEQWFQGDHLVSIAATPTVTTPGNLAMQLADNYATLFSFNKMITR
jgi:hypothetical protein